MSTLQRLVTAALVLVAWTASAEATPQDYTSPFDANVQAIVGNFNETISIRSISVPQITMPNLLELKVDLGDIDITGCSNIKGSQLTYDPDSTIVKVSLHEPKLEIFAHQVTMKGVLFGNINIDGTGDGWFLLENFDMSIEGNTSTFNFNGPEPIIVFEDVKLTLDLAQWTVDMRGLTPDSDLIQIVDSVLTMMGPEIFHALGDIITGKPFFKPLVNKFFSDPNTAIPEPAESPDGPTEEQGKTIEEQSENFEEQDEMIKKVSGVGTQQGHQELKLEHPQLRHPRQMASLGGRPSPLY